jgi:hypothetical protein
VRKTKGLCREGRGLFSFFAKGSKSRMSIDSNPSSFVSPPLPLGDENLMRGESAVRRDLISGRESWEMLR